VRAAYASAFGGEDPLANLALGELPPPEPAPGWALVRVTAASLNHHDLWTLGGVSSRPLQAPQILGCDGAGCVEAWGEGTEAPSTSTELGAGGVPPAGSRVVCHSVIGCGGCPECGRGRPELCHRLALLSEPPYGGTLAELVAVPAANLVPLPETVSDEAAACLPTAYLTAHRMLFARAGLRAGMSVLVQGASGGVATAAILLAGAAGVEVHVCARDPAKREFAESLGAASSFAPDDREALRELLRRSGGGVDAVVETVGEATWELSLRAVRPGGTVAVAGATTGANPPAQLNRVFWRQLTIAGTTMGTRTELEQLVGMCASGAIRPLIDSVVTLEETPRAMARLARGDQRGKLVIRPAPS